MNDLSPVLTRHKLDVDAFVLMAEAGVIGRDERIELIDGELLDMAPIGDEHMNMVDVLTEILVLACQGRASVSVQNSLKLSSADMPQPDFAIFRRPVTTYEPGERDRRKNVLLLIEVAETSLQYDRTVKLDLYAKFGVPEYWIVDLKNRIITVHRNPSEGGFDHVTTVRLGTELSLAAAPDVVIDLGRILG